MFKVTFSNYADVAKFAEAFGQEALISLFRLENHDYEQKRFIREAVKYSTNTEVLLDSFNDGNNEWEEYITMADSMEEAVYTRYGFGAGSMPFLDYLKSMQGTEKAKEALNTYISRTSHLDQLKSLVGIDLDK